MKLIEYGHLYVDDLLTGKMNKAALQRSIDLAKDVAQPGDHCWVLLDDKSITRDQGEQRSVIIQANGLFEELGLLPHQYHFEKTFAQEASYLLQSLPQHQLRWESFRKQEKRVLFFHTAELRIALAHEFAHDNIRHYSCPLLASLWRRFKQRHAEDTITILEKRYQAVEQQVDVLLRASGHTEEGRHQYMWY